MDFDDIHEQAKDLKHGKDLGNGWAIWHPIKKQPTFKGTVWKRRKVERVGDSDEPLF
jgi:hypothetical protein